MRLTTKGHEIGLVSDEKFAAFLAKKEHIENEVKRLEETYISPIKASPFLEEMGEPAISRGISLAELLRRPTVTYEALAPLDTERPELTRAEKTSVEVTVKYEGYIKRQIAEVQRHERLEVKPLPEDLDYSQIKGLRLEAIQKLNQIKPLTIGQASRISGVSPADVSVLIIWLASRGGEAE